MRFPEEFSKGKEISELLQKAFSKEDLDGLARYTGFVQKERKLTGHSFAQLCIQGVSQEGLAASLTELCGTAQSLGVEMVRQSLDGRFTAAAAAFMEAVLGRCVRMSLGEQLGLLTMGGFTGIYLQDATLWQLPPRLSPLFRGSAGGASGAGIKVDAMFELTAGDWKLQFKDAASADCGRGSAWTCSSSPARTCACPCASSCRSCPRRRPTQSGSGSGRKHARRAEPSRRDSSTCAASACTSPTC